MRSGIPCLVALALSATTSFSEAPDATPACRDLSVRGLRARDSNSPLRTFSATAVGDVTLRIVVGAGLRGDHLLEWRIFDQTGSLYQSITKPIGDAPGKRAIPGYPNPERIVVPSPADETDGINALKLTQSFAIGGTMIQTNALYGVWRLEALLDGQPYCKPYKFRITH